MMTKSLVQAVGAERSAMLSQTVMMAMHRDLVAASDPSSKFACRNHEMHRQNGDRRRRRAGSRKGPLSEPCESGGVETYKGKKEALTLIRAGKWGGS